MRLCPRCTKLRPDHWFPTPVKLCIACYAAIPENKGLTTAELYTKATKSRYARLREKASPFEARFEQELAGSAGVRFVEELRKGQLSVKAKEWVHGLADKAATQQQEGEDDRPLAPCSKCHAMFAAEDMNFNPTTMEHICAECSRSD